MAGCVNTLPVLFLYNNSIDLWNKGEGGMQVPFKGEGDVEYMSSLFTYHNFCYLATKELRFYSSQNVI